MRARRWLRPLASALVGLATGYFLLRAFERHYAEVKAHPFRLSPAFLAPAVAFAVVTVLLGTFAWHCSINALAPRKVAFSQSVAAVNASGLTKYIPGKVWSYALQMYWLDGLGVPKALVVYANLVNLLISLGTSLIFGVGCLILSPLALPLGWLLFGLFALLVIDALGIALNRPLLNALVAAINRLFKRNLAYFEVRRSLLLKLHSIHLSAAVTAALSVYLFCFAIGYRVDFGHGLLVVGSSLVAEVVGFLAIIVPGGLGVREALMYGLISRSSQGSLSVVLPVASRLMSMGVDVGLGLVALRLLRSLRAVPPPRA